MMDQLTDVTNGFLVYVTMVLAATYLIATNVEKIGGVFFRIAERRRRMAAERQSADITSMKRQIGYLTETVERLEFDLEEERQARNLERKEAVKAVDSYRAQYIALTEWAYQAQLAVAQGKPLPPPPSTN